MGRHLPWLLSTRSGRWRRRTQQLCRHDTPCINTAIDPASRAGESIAIVCSMRAIRPLFLLWLYFVLVSYYGLLFTYWGNYFHGGGPLDKALLSAAIVVATYLSLEVFRNEKRLRGRVISAVVGLPLFAFACFDLWFAVKYAIQYAFPG